MAPSHRAGRCQLAGSAPTPAMRAEGSPSPHCPLPRPGPLSSCPHGPSACAQSPDAQMRGESHAVTRPLRALECTEFYMRALLTGLYSYFVGLPFKFTCTCILRALIIVKNLKRCHLTRSSLSRPGTQPSRLPPRACSACSEGGSESCRAAGLVSHSAAWLPGLPHHTRGHTARLCGRSAP